MIFFITDACALARVYVPDVGTRNMLAIYRYAQSLMIAPNIVYPETVSAFLESQRAGLIDPQQYAMLRARLRLDIETRKVILTRVERRYLDLAADLLERYKLQPRKSLGGADSIYLSLAVDLAGRVKPEGDRVILVTSDGALYHSALDEPDIVVFHFWTCNFGCACNKPFVPVKGVMNSCPTCGKTCAVCRYDVCPSTYVPGF